MWASFSRPVRAMIAMALVSCLGSGLTYPFLLIYLHEVRHIPLAVTGLLIALPAVVGLLATPSTGSLVDAIGARAVLSGSTLAAALGSGLLPIVRGAPSALLPLILYGIGTSGIATAVNTLFAQLIRDPVIQARAFGVNFMVANLGLAGGALAAAAIVSVHRPGTFTLIYLLDALSFFLPGVVAPFLRLSDALGDRPGSASLAEAAEAAKARPPRRPRFRTAGSWRAVLANRVFVRYVLALGAIYLVGYGAVDAGFVGYSVTAVHVTPSLVAESFAVNFVVIICLQQVMTRFVERIRRSTALVITSVAFGVAWLTVWCAAQFPGQLAGRVLVVVFGGVFAIGEMSLSPVRNVLVNALASEELRGRYNAASWSVIQTANVIAPAIIGVMLGASLGGSMVVGLVVVAALVSIGALRIGRLLTPEQDNRALAVATAIAGGNTADPPPTSAAPDSMAR